jgi:hypothetical protein
MDMKLALAIALESSSTECKVELIDGRETITAKVEEFWRKRFGRDSAL